MKTLLRACLYLSLLAAPLAAAETVQLKDGTVLLGDVQVLDDGITVQITIRYPEAGKREVRMEEITSRSLYWIMERRTASDDADGRERLASLAAEAGMTGIAIHEYMAVKELDPSRSRKIETIRKELTERIARGLLEEAQEQLDAGQPRTALVYLHTIGELYPRTSAARDSRQLMTRAHDRAGQSVDIAEKTVSAKQASRVLEDVSKKLGKADDERAKLGGHIGSTMAASTERRLLEKSLHWYRSAWEDARTLPVAVDDAGLRSRIAEARRRTREKLVSTNLEAASLQLQRNSITRAEEYCNVACDLDPDNKESHTIHRLILEAKAYGFQ